MAKPPSKTYRDKDDAFRYALYKKKKKKANTMTAAEERRAWAEYRWKGKPFESFSTKSPKARAAKQIYERVLREIMKEERRKPVKAKRQKRRKSED